MSQTRAKGRKNRDGSRTRTANETPSQPTAGRKTNGPTPRTVSRGSAARKTDRKTWRIGLAVGTVLVVAIIIAIAVLKGNANGSNANALTDPNGLNSNTPMLSVGTPAPDFDLATSSGQHYKLSDLRGHPALLEFFAIWCPHCQNEAPILNQVDSAFAPSGEHTLSILASPYGKNYDTSGGIDRRLADPTDLSWFQTTFNVQHPMLIDPKFATVNAYGANSYPTIYVLDSNGVIRFAQSGDVAYQDLADALNKAK